MSKKLADELTDAIVKKDEEQMKKVLSKSDESFVNNINSKGYPSIAVAAVEMFEEGMNLLLEQQGIDLNSKTKLDKQNISSKERRNIGTLEGASALSILSKQASGKKGEKASRMASILLDNGAEADVQNDKGNTPLHDAIDARDYNLVKALLESGADPNTPNKAGYTPLHLAANNSDKEGLDMLLESGRADVNKKVQSADGEPFARSQGANPLMLVAKNASLGQKDKVMEMAKSLIKEGSEVNGVKDINGDTILHHATRRGIPELVGVLTEAGVDGDPRQKNNDGESAIDITRQARQNIARSTQPDEVKERHFKSNSEIAEIFETRLKKGASAAIEESFDLNSDTSNYLVSFLEDDKSAIAKATMINSDGYKASQDVPGDKIKDILEQGPKSATEQALNDSDKSKGR